MRYLLIPCLFFLSWFATYGQQLFDQNYPIDVYQGASQSWAIKQDKYGVVYIANTEGLLRYDGAYWELMSLPDKDAIYSVDTDSKGKIYICSDYELGYFEMGFNGKYEYHSLISDLPDSCRQNMNVSLVKVFDNKVFFKGTSHLYIYANGKLEAQHIRSSGLITTRNNLYLKKGSGLYKYGKDGFESTPYFKKMEDKVFKWITDHSENSLLLLDDKNQIWLVNEKHPDEWSVLSENLNRSLKNLKINTIASLDNGNIAVNIGTEILFFNSKGELVYRINKEDLSIWGFILEDKQHNIWLNADSNIIQVITSSPLSYYDGKNGLKGFIISLGSAGHHQYVGTDKGIFYQNQKGRGTFTSLPGVTGSIWNFYNFHNTVYACHDSSVLELQGSKTKLIIEHQWVLSLCELKKRTDRMIMGTYNTGIWLLQQKRSKWFKKRIKGFEEETRHIQEDEEGNIWISHFNKGIWKLKLNEDSDSVISKTFYDRTNGLPSNINNRIHQLNGKIVVSTIDGIYSYNRKSNLFEPEEAYRKALGKGFCIYTLTQSTEGDIYFWGAQPKGKETAGVLKKQPDGSYELLLTPFNKIAVSFRSLRVDVDAPMLVTNSGEVWIGNDRKVFSYNPNQKAFYNDSIQVSIQKVWASDSLIYQNSTTESRPALSFAFNNLKFEFLCSSLEDTEMNQYQYKVEGFESKWSNWTFARDAHYTNLPAGDYTFYVRAKNVYDVVSKPASFPFHINPPWYNTRLAYFIYIVSFFILLHFLIQYSIRREKKQKKILEGIVNEKTRELVDVNNLLSSQNDQLQNANTIIESQNKEIKNRNETLEDEVHKRTKELVEYNQQLEQFAFVTAHNLRGPVARMLGLGTILRMTDSSSEEAQSITDKMLFTAEEIDSVIKDLNQILQVKNTPNQLEELDLAEEISKVISRLEREISSTKASIRSNVSEIKAITTSHAYFNNIVYQLLSNCIKFRHPERTPDIRITAVSTPDYICLIISDNGLGINLQKNKGKIFTLYGRFHLHIEGKGLGLYLAKTQILSLGGRIEVESEENTGTTFKVFFRT